MTQSGHGTSSVATLCVAKNDRHTEFRARWRHSLLDGCLDLLFALWYRPSCKAYHFLPPHDVPRDRRAAPHDASCERRAAPHDASSDRCAVLDPVPCRTVLERRVLERLVLERLAVPGPRYLTPLARWSAPQNPTQRPVGNRWFIARPRGELNERGGPLAQAHLYKYRAHWRQRTSGKSRTVPLHARRSHTAAAGGRCTL